ncbi:hypothetical protein B4098_2089 [Heyndrickxia coagulans]|uniref:Uncharacterized protein n=1 Tax=Heyndrickxia coagulans TaxID=1398 RepID=A0A150K6B0_HEYCO|nr:hypothetical protein B4098_2089 [Heyndrickxia coagulans]KYC64748.1 hypothetical protein B4099_0189 [Heyndrickxia coagulans]
MKRTDGRIPVRPFLPAFSGGFLLIEVAQKQCPFLVNKIIRDGYFAV